MCKWIRGSSVENKRHDRKELLTSQRDNKDKRIQKLDLTEKAIEINQRLMPIMERRQHHLLADVSPEELVLFYRVIDKIKLHYN